jgi:hypothetical protein
VDPRADLDDFEKRKLSTLPGLELRPLSRPARSQSLYRLRYPGSLYVLVLSDNFASHFETKFDTRTRIMIVNFTFMKELITDCVLINLEDNIHFCVYISGNAINNFHSRK